MDNPSIGGSWKGCNPPPAVAASRGIDAARETDGISVLPPEILSQVFSLLGKDIQYAALVSRSWYAQAKDNIKRKEMELLQSYSKILADNLDGVKYPLEKNELLRLSEDNHILNCESLGEIKIFLLEVRGNIESQLSKLDQNDFRNLRKLTKNENMPRFHKIIFDHVVIEKSLNKASHLRDPKKKSFALKKICKQLVKLGELNRALKIARTIPISARSDEMKTNICTKFIKKGFIEKALEIAATIQSRESFKVICWRLTDANKVDQAMEVARNLDTKYLRSFAFWGICMSWNSSKQFDDAITVANRIEDDELRTKAFWDICWSLNCSKQFDHAIAIAGRIEDTKCLRSIAFQNICLSLNSSKQFDHAIAVAGRIEDDELRGVALQRISTDLLYSGKLEESKRIALIIPTSYSRSYALEKICYVLKEQVRIDELIEVACSIPDSLIEDSLLWQALHISENMCIKWIRSAVHLVACIIGHAKNGQIEEAKKVANNMDRRLRTEAYANICYILLARDFNEAKKFAALISDEGTRKYMYGLIVFHIFNKDKLMTAEDFANLISVLNETDDYKAMVLTLIVSRLIKLNKREDAIILINSMPEGRIKNGVLHGFDRKDAV